MDVAAGLVLLAVVLGAVTWVCDRTGWPTPLVLVVLGAAVSFVPGVPDVRLDPELVLIGMLPPLLYAATARTSLFDVRATIPSTLMLSVVLVVVSTFAVGLVAWLLVPSLTAAGALALGAVVAPPDAVAATAVGRRLGLPRVVTNLLEQESLVNDATALVALGVAVTALTESVSPVGVAGRFVLAAGGGVAVGLAVAVVLGAVRRRLEDPVLDTTLSFAAPYLAFLPAEEIGASGVLAVVVTGLVLAHRSPTLQSASSRVAEATNWATVAFLLENAVFLLIGLQLPRLLDDVGSAGLSTGATAGLCLAALATTVLVRGVFVHAVATVLRHGTGRMRRLAWPRGVPTIVSWAGMRGVVTLAAAFLLPEDVPHRDALLLAAFTVVAGTLLLQGLTLPWLVRRVGLPGPDPAEDALHTAELSDASSRAALARLDDLLDGSEPPDVVENLRTRARSRSDAAWERLGPPSSERMTPSATYCRLRREMLAAERETVLAARDAGRADREVLRAALASIDLEESMLERVDDLSALERDRELAPQDARLCRHLLQAPPAPAPLTPGVCGDCVREGTTWVHLRLCLTCGTVGCCDSSPRRHARGHHERTGHPVIVSAEAGEAWRWCWLHEQLG